MTAIYLPGKTIAECAAEYTKMGLAVVEIPRGSNIPRHPKWNEPTGYVTSPDVARKTWGRGQNMGVVLGPSRVCTLDLDDVENSRIALKAAGINLDLLLDNESAVKLIGNPDNHAKLVFRVPEGFELNTKRLSWPSDKKPGEMVPIFELRGGRGDRMVRRHTDPRVLLADMLPVRCKGVRRGPSDERVPSVQAGVEGRIEEAGSGGMICDP